MRRWVRVACRVKVRRELPLDILRRNAMAESPWLLLTAGVLSAGIDNNKWTIYARPACGPRAHIPTGWALSPSPSVGRAWTAALAGHGARAAAHHGASCGNVDTLRSALGNDRGGVARGLEGVSDTGEGLFLPKQPQLA